MRELNCFAYLVGGILLVTSCAEDKSEVDKNAVQTVGPAMAEATMVIDFDDSAQIEAELRAQKLMETPEVRAAQAELRKNVYAPRAGESQDRLAMMDLVLEEVAYAGGLWSATNDPGNPAIIWFNNPPHMTRGVAVSGGRFGTDNPDRIYRYFPIDPAYKYEIHGRRSMSSPPTQFLLEACEDKPPAWGYPLKFLLDHEIDYDADGAFVITVDRSPADGRRNHLQLPDGAAHVLLRDTLVDWQEELPTQAIVKRVSGPDVIDPITEDVVLKRLGDAIADQSFYGLEWEDHPVLGITPAIVNEQMNVFVRPSTPDQKAWGMTGPGRFKIADDEAVVITIEKQTAAYIGVQITDPWLLSRDYINHTTSLNDVQAWSNPDNTITYVIAKEDPGVQNWLDTVGLNEVSLMLRMEIFDNEPNPETAVRQIEVVKLEALQTALPHPMPSFSADDRGLQIEQRRAGYAKRVEVLTPTR